MDDSLEVETATTKKRGLPPKLGMVLLSIGVLVGILLGLQNVMDTRTAKENSTKLSQEIIDRCASSGSYLVENRDICKRAEQVKQDPSQPIPGPKGDKGDPGDDGANGMNGSNGTSGSKGADGADGSAGLNGTDGSAGLNGLDGAAGSTGPKGDTGATGPKGDTGATGPKGDKGDPGDVGQPGAAVQSFTFNDANGVAYLCSPNPPGSLTYTCAPVDATVPTIEPTP